MVTMLLFFFFSRISSFRHRPDSPDFDRTFIPMWFNTFERNLRISNKQKFGFLEHKNTYRFVWKGIHFTETYILKTPYRLYENTTLCCIKCISGKKNTYNILTIQHTMGKKQLSITKFLKRTLKYIAWIQYALW